MCTEFSCCGCHPAELDSAPLAFSCAFFFGLYGPPLTVSRTQPSARLYNPQSLYGTLSRPTVQSSRGSIGTVLSCASNQLLSAFQLLGSVTASGNPVAGSVLKKLTRFCEG